MAVQSSNQFNNKPSPGVHIQSTGPTVVFLTVCIQDRKPLLLLPGVKQVLHSLWEKTAKSWLVGDYLLMPDHLHLFCVPGAPYAEIERWIAYWKDQASKKLGWPKGTWQRLGWHHRIRNGREHTEQWHYMQMNPQRAGLISEGAEWEHQGRVHEWAANW